MILAEPLAPGREILAKRFADRGTLAELDAMSLAVIESNRLDPRKSIECQGKTSRRILAAGKQDERPRRGSGHRAEPERPGGTANAAPACRLAMRSRGRAKILPPERPGPGNQKELELLFACDCGRTHVNTVAPTITARALVVMWSTRSSSPSAVNTSGLGLRMRGTLAATP